MTEFDLEIKNAEIITYHQNTQKMIREKTNIYIHQGRIQHIGSAPAGIFKQSLDLKGLLVLPGVIDSQVHFREPGMTHKEDLETGTRSALLGGVTTVFEMPNTQPPTTSVAMVNQKMDLAKGRAHTHYAFFGGVSADNLNQLLELEALNYSPGLKLFLGASFGSLLIDDDTVFEKVMQTGRRRITVHSEDEKRLRERKQIAIDSGHPRSHHIWRDEESALISTKKTIALAEKYNRPVHILHISSCEEMHFLKDHKKIATVEILPQYLTFSAPECYERFGTLTQQNPPIRDQRHMEHLWKAVLDRTVDVIGSDHAPHTLEEKNKPYPQSPSGFPGTQTLLPVMLNHVHEGRLPLERLVELVTESPRRIFGLKNKGRIEVGYDADLTIIDPKKEFTITNKWIASKCGYSPFDGFKVTGFPVAAFLKGVQALEDGVIIRPHAGQPVEFTL